MTAVSHLPRTASPASYGDAVPSALTDQLVETVTSPPDAHARSVVIAALTLRVFEAIRWLHGSNPDREELASLYRVLAEAYAHRSRMAARKLASSRR